MVIMIQITVTLAKSLICARHCAKCPARIKSFNPHSDPVRWVLALSLGSPGHLPSHKLRYAAGHFCSPCSCDAACISSTRPSPHSGGLLCTPPQCSLKTSSRIAHRLICLPRSLLSFWHWAHKPALSNFSQLTRLLIAGMVCQDSHKRVCSLELGLWSTKSKQ